MATWNSAMERKTPRQALAAWRTALPLAQPLDEPEAQPPVGIRVADEVEEHGVGFRRFQRSNERIGAFFDHDMHLKILDVKTIVRLRWRHAGNDKPAVDPEPAEFSGEDKRVVANPIDSRRQGGNDGGHGHRKRDLAMFILFINNLDKASFLCKPNMEQVILWETEP